MVKRKLSWGIIFLIIVMLLAAACSDSDDEGESANPSSPTPQQSPTTTTTITQSQSQVIAETFVKESPTFAFDGIAESLKLTDTMVLRCPSCWQFIFNFESRQAGYGDRAGQMLAQVITPHTATVTVNQGTVTSADLDGRWDMLKQEMIPLVGGECHYDDIDGVARIVSVSDADSVTSDCKYTVEITFDFVPTDPSAPDHYRFPNWQDTGQHLTVGGGMNPPRAWAEAQGLTEGSEHHCIRSEINEGTCTPVIFLLPDIDPEGWESACSDTNNPESDITSQVEGNTAFAFDLYQAIRNEEGNLFYSPYSISTALAMTYAGAHGETAAQMANTLHFILSQKELHPAFKALAQELASRGEGAEGKDGEGFRLNVVNALWGQEGHPFLPEFLDLIAEDYGAGMNLLDFINAPEESRITINNWVSEQTEGKIEDLIPQGVIDALTRLVLTNAVYFNAAWASPFEENATMDGTFYLNDGSEVTVPMMHQTERFKYAKGNGYQAVELPYDGNELSMIILLPDADTLETFEGSLNAGRFDSILEDLSYEQVSLTLPKFNFESSFSLSKTLAAMGMPDAFSDAADFSEIDGTQDLSISEVLHKAFIDVDEAGTEAAAATAVVISLTAAPAMPISLTVDHPFLFAIRDIDTGSIPLLGRVMNPSL